MLCSVCLSIREGWCSPALLTLLFLLGTLPLVTAADSATEAHQPDVLRSEADAHLRIAVLREEIARHDQLYFEKNQPVISDYAYDQLKRRLQALEAQYPSIAADTAPRLADTATGSLAHLTPMLGLDKAYTRDEWERFHGAISEGQPEEPPMFIVEPKYDGLAVNLIFKDGTFSSAATRGDGLRGEDITENVRTISGLPHQLARHSPDGRLNPIPQHLELRGEIFIPLSQFAALNTERAAAGDEPYASPRNLAAGVIRRRDPSEVAGVPLAIVLFAIGAGEPADGLPDSQEALHRQIADWGLPGIAQFQLCPGETVWETVQSQAPLRKSWDFPSDGVVIKVNSHAQQQHLGEGPAAPRWALAFKFTPAQARTRLEAVEFQIGRTGVMTPVAVFMPVMLDGARIQRASLHNVRTLRALNLYAGDWLMIERVGKIIPQIAQVDATQRAANASPIALPVECPACGAELENTGPDLRCPAHDCPAKLQRQLAHFAGQSAVAIRGLGPATAEALVTGGLVRTLPDLYQLGDADRSEMREAGIDSPEVLLAAIDARRSTAMWRYLVGLIPGVGPSTAQQLAYEFPSFDGLLRATPKQLEEVPGIGNSSAASIAHFLHHPTTVELFQHLKKAGVRPRQESDPVGGE